MTAPRTRFLAIGLLLSAVGMTLLVLGALSGRDGSAYLLRQGLGHALGIAYFVSLTGRWRPAMLRRVTAAPLPAVLMGPSGGLRTIDRIVLAQGARLIAVITVPALVSGRSYAAPVGGSADKRLIRYVSLGLGTLALGALFAGGLAPALAVLIVATVTMRSGGLSKRQALLPSVVFLVLLGAFIGRATSQPLGVARLRGCLQSRISLFDRDSQRILADRRDWLADASPKGWAEHALVTVAARADYPAAGVVIVLFLAIAWIGRSQARGAADPGGRAQVAGAMAALLAPAALHTLGTVVFLTGSGLLPFVSYGPAAVFVDWALLALVASPPSLA